MINKLDPYTEFETKYRAEIATLMEFKRTVEAIPGHVFRYVQGDDYYYTKPNSPFQRLRVGQYPGPDGKIYMQLTMKSKPDGAKNNIIRHEPNIDLAGNDLEQVKNFIDMDERKLNFRIWKSAHIYEFSDATVVFYTVIEYGSAVQNHFVEIEVKEETIQELTEQDAWNVISKYEKILSRVGVNPQKRLRNSLYDMYCRKE